MSSMIAINPTTGQRLREYETMSDADAAAAVDAAHEAWQVWRQTPFDERAALLRRAAERLREGAERYAALMADEMGKPLAEGRAEIEKCAWCCDYYAENGAAFLAPEVVESDATTSYVTFQPLGVVLAVMPWNFPFWQLFRFVAPALMAGNAALLKHASNVPGCALAIEALLHEAGVPRDLFRSLLVGSSQVAALIEHPLVRAVTLTGSTPAGRAVAAQAGAALKKCVLELGGSDPYLILDDADVAQAAATCASARLINGGQSCIAAKRFIVVESVRRRFETLFVSQMRAAVMGDPHDPATTLGPQARAELRDELHAQVERSIEAGARLLLGGYRPEGAGAFYPPTVLTDVAAGMAAYEEELFGPVAAIIPVADEAEALRVANDTSFGLGAAIFTQDVARGERLAAEALEAGACFVNGNVKSDPRLPFGGIKESGYGRELSYFGIREFVNVKTVWVR